MRAINVQCAQSCYLSLVLFMFAQYSFIEIQINVPWLSKRRKKHTRTHLQSTQQTNMINIPIYRYKNKEKNNNQNHYKYHFELEKKMHVNILKA